MNICHHKIGVKIIKTEIVSFPLLKFLKFEIVSMKTKFNLCIAINKPTYECDIMEYNNNNKKKAKYDKNIREKNIENNI